MNILLTGGAGFIGSHVYDQFILAGHKVFVVDDLSTGREENLANGWAYQTSICDYDGLENLFTNDEFDVVCHHAAQISVSESVADPREDARVNALGLLTVLEAMRKSGKMCKRFIFASSGGTLYGDIGIAAREWSELNPCSPYGIHKWLGEKYLEFYAREYGLEVVSLRYGNVYGPRQNPYGEAGVIGIFCKKTLAGEDITIHGRGNCVRDYVYVEDVAAANVAALTVPVISGKLAAFNIGTGVGTDVITVANLVRREAVTQNPSLVLGKIHHGPDRPGDLKYSVLNPVLAQSELNWQATTPLEVGIAKTVAWFKSTDS